MFRFAALALVLLAGIAHTSTTLALASAPDCGEGAIEMLFAAKQEDDAILKARAAVPACNNPVIAARLYRAIAINDRRHGRESDALVRAAELGSAGAMLDLAAELLVRDELDQAAMWTYRAFGYVSGRSEWLRADRIRIQIHTVIAHQGVEPQGGLVEVACNWAPVDPSGAITLDTERNRARCLASQNRYVGH